MSGRLFLKFLERKRAFATFFCHELPIQRVVEDLAAEFEDFVLHIGPATRGSRAASSSVDSPRAPPARVSFSIPPRARLPPPRNLGHLKQASLHVHRRQIAKGDKLLPHAGTRRIAARWLGFASYGPIAAERNVTLNVLSERRCGTQR